MQGIDGANFGNGDEATVMHQSLIRPDMMPPMPPYGYAGFQQLKVPLPVRRDGEAP